MLETETLNDYQVFQDLQSFLSGNVFKDEETLNSRSTDLGNCQIMPSLVVFPRHAKDVEQLVQYVAEHKAKAPQLSITARSAGIDITGGPLNDSIILDMSKYMIQFESLSRERAVVQPGIPFHEFDRVTKLQYQAMLPTYPASRDLCSVGGMVCNNSGGEKAYAYGKTDEFIEALKVVLRDGREHTFYALDEKELKRKMEQPDLEGEIYREMFKLINTNYELIQRAKPPVSKNSAGYYLWNVWNREQKIFNLNRLFAGAQGTLGLVTEITTRLVPFKPHAKLMVIFLDNADKIPELIKTLAGFHPEEMEMYHRSSFEMVIRHFPEYIKTLKENPFAFGFKFMPEVFDFLEAGAQPEYFLLPKFSGFSMQEADKLLQKAYEAIKPMNLEIHITESKADVQKYSVVRHKTFYFFRKTLGHRNEVLFFDDIVVPLEALAEVLPKLLELIKPYHCEFFLVAHIGNGNIHFVPFWDMTDPKTPGRIKEMTEKVHGMCCKGMVPSPGSITTG
jgi:FAD/FMN-containing dehydrogenase